MKKLDNSIIPLVGIENTYPRKIKVHKINLNDYMCLSNIYLENVPTLSIMPYHPKTHKIQIPQFWTLKIDNLMNTTSVAETNLI